MAYSEGFSPRPKIHYGLALPTGSESVAEYIDLDVVSEVELDPLALVLSEGLPDGVEIRGIAEVASNADALQALVDRCTWEFEINPGDGGRAAVEQSVQALMSRDEVELTFERKGKSITENIRPALISATVGAELRTDAVVLTVDLATKPRSIRPSEFLACLEPAVDVGRTCRIEQWTTIDGETQPLLAGSEPSRPVTAQLAS